MVNKVEFINFCGKMIICIKCKEIKFENEFHKEKQNKNGLSSICKKCKYERNLNYDRTIKGVINKIWQKQLFNSNKRKHPKPNYTKKELEEWILNQSNFEKLYNDWVNSGYDKWLKPSVDRLDDTIGYNFNNIQLITWKENDLKFKNKKYDKKSKTIS